MGLFELVGAVHDELDLAPGDLMDALEAVVVEVDVLDAAVAAVDVAEGRREEVDAGGDEAGGLVGGEDALEVAGVLDAVLAAVDATRFGLGGDAVRVAVGDELGRLGEVLFLLVVAHVDHDAVEAARLDGPVDRFRRLRVVQVQRHGHRRGPARLRRQRHQQVVHPVVDRPGEEEDLRRGSFRLGRADDGKDRF